MYCTPLSSHTIALWGCLLLKLTSVTGDLQPHTWHIHLVTSQASPGLNSTSFSIQLEKLHPSYLPLLDFSVQLITSLQSIYPFPLPTHLSKLAFSLVWIITIHPYKGSLLAFCPLTSCLPTVAKAAFSTHRSNQYPFPTMLPITLS